MAGRRSTSGNCHGLIMILITFNIIIGLTLGAVPIHDAQSLEFTDVDTRDGYLSGIGLITRASNESTITHYAIYFSKDSSSGAQKYILDLNYPHRAVLDLIQLPDAANPAHPSGKIKVLIPPIKVPEDAVSLIVISANSDGEKEGTSAVLSISDKTSDSVPLCLNQTLNYPSAAFSDGSGDANYSSSVDNGEPYACKWEISNSNVAKILFRMTYLQLDPFDYDSVCVYESDGTTLIDCYRQSSGPVKDYNVVSKDNSIVVIFSVSSSTGGAGFRAVYYGLDANDYTNTVADSVLKIRYDQHIPVDCHCTDVSCQGMRANCIVDEGNGKSFSTTPNQAGTPASAISYVDYDYSSYINN